MKALGFNLSLALRTISSNLLRSMITILIITLGITALVGILTATDVMKEGVNSNFNSLGANTIQITNTSMRIKGGGRAGGRAFENTNKISYQEALQFKTQYNFPNSLVGLSFSGTMVATVQAGTVKTHPNIKVLGIDQNYLKISQSNLLVGRNLSTQEEEMGAKVCILGYGIAKTLFKKPQLALGKWISVGAYKYNVVGVATEKGGSMMLNLDNMVFLPLQTARSMYGAEPSYVLSVWIPDVAYKDLAVEEAEGLFRVIRRISLGAANDFSIQKNDAMVEMVNDIIGKIGWAAIVIALVTLLGSIIGLMNIMLVAVVERTREIGISKSLGAKASTIKQQFLLEALMISLLGGLLGIIFSLFIGVGLASYFHVAFHIPWAWILLGFSVCTIVGIVSGIYPAIKASKLDPIEALRIA